MQTRIARQTARSGAQTTVAETLHSDRRAKHQTRPLRRVGVQHLQRGHEAQRLVGPIVAIGIDNRVRSIDPVSFQVVTDG